MHATTSACVGCPQQNVSMVTMPGRLFQAVKQIMLPHPCMELTESVVLQLRIRWLS
jgi:hypothetical protein